MSNHSHPVSSDLVFQGGRKQAKEQGYQFYDTGQPCKRGHLSYRTVNGSNCIMCLRELGRESGRRYRRRHPMRVIKANRRHRELHPVEKRLQSVRSRCKKKGFPFDEEAWLETWNARGTHCPVLGIKYFTGEGRHQDSTPEMDRLVPELGYVRGNMNVISRRANTIKNNASAEEIQRVADWTKEKETKK